jgi:hypothetical protein
LNSLQVCCKFLSGETDKDTESLLSLWVSDLGIAQPLLGNADVPAVKEEEVKAMPFFLVLSLLLATSCEAAPAQSAQSTKPSFSVAVSANQRTVKSGSEIRVRIVLTNVSDKELATYQDGATRGELDYTIDVLDGNGKEPPETKYLRAVRNKDAAEPGETTTLVVLRDAGMRSLKSKGTLTDILDLSKLYDLQPGTYTLQVERTDEESKTVVKSNKITLTVIP